MQSPATVPIAPALADLAFASASDSQVSRSLAWTSPVDLGIDLNDPAQRRFGDYELLELIGQGGMGAVYRAHQHNLDREVALKFLAAGPWASDEFIARFRREAQAAARMQHPNIVEIYDTGVRDGLYYFSMRLVKGETLADRLRAKGPMAIKQAAAMMRTIAEAIDYAHRLGVLHLDLKPGNVLLGERDEPLVADFGLARRIDEGPSEQDNVSGTPSYMAPEQATAKSSGIGPAADIYGLGAILYEMLVGEPPFRGRDVKETLQHVLRDEPVAPKSRRHDVPADLNAICLKCLAKEPALRYTRARELADELGRFIEGAHVHARAPSGIERLRRWVRRNPWQTVAYIVFAGGLVITTNEMRAAVLARELAEAHRVSAEKASQRSQELVSLLGQAFVVPKDSGSRAALEDSAQRIVRWLRDNLAGDAVAQSDVLVALIDALDRADNVQAAQALVWPVLDLLGHDYRQQVIAEHLARGTPRNRMLAAAMMQYGEEDAEARNQQSDLLGSALAEAPEDLDVAVAAFLYCSKDSDCWKLDPLERMSRLEPENAANWALRISSEGESDPLNLSYLQRAAEASYLDDHFPRTFALTFEAIRTSSVPIPEVMRRTVERLSPGVEVKEIVGWFQNYSMPIPAWNHLVAVCRPEPGKPLPRPRRSHCLAVANRAAYEAKGLITKMIGSVIIRLNLPGTPDAERARDLRRHYVYVYDTRDSRTPQQVRESRDELMGRETLAFDELEAAKRTLDRAGLPRDPPADWEPEDPVRLMTGYERDIYRQKARELARQPLLPEAPSQSSAQRPAGIE
jgi:serine/threonine protein kinase